MKKVLTAILALIATPSIAQITGDGYYRLQNNGSERYITITDNVITNVTTSSIIDYNNITTWKGFDNVKSNPGSIILIKAVKDKYDLSAQGISVHDITGGKAYVTLEHRVEDIYIIKASATQSGVKVTKTLYDSSTDDEYDYVGDSGASTHQYWRIKPVNTDDNYIGITPKVHANDGWYGTIYAEFPFKLASEGMTAYYVDGVKAGVFQLKEITDEIKPAATPIIIKCSSNDAAQNKILPVIASTTTPQDNYLGGTYFDSSMRNHIARVEYNKETMRILYADENGELVFKTAAEKDLTNKLYIKKNTAWLNVPTGLTGDFKHVDRDTYSGINNIEASLPKTAQKGTYTLTGVQVDDTKALRPGIYIQNGKKIIIK